MKIPRPGQKNPVLPLCRRETGKVAHRAPFNDYIDRNNLAAQFRHRRPNSKLWAENPGSAPSNAEKLYRRNTAGKIEFLIEI